MEKCRVFVDFWNFQIGWNDWCVKQIGNRKQIPWPTLPTELIRHGYPKQDVRFCGIHVYASVNPHSPKDLSLKKWLTNELRSYTGYSVSVFDRARKQRPCPHCGEDIESTIEKGVDSALITDILTMGFDDLYDVAILISGDADHAPAIEYIQKHKNKQVTRVYFKRHGHTLRNTCWSHSYLDDLIPAL